MLAMITGVTAYGYDARKNRILLSTIIGALLAIAGFYLNYVAGWKKDKAAGNGMNPVASGRISVGMTIAIISLCLVLGFGLTFRMGPFGIVPFLGIVLIFFGLATGLLQTPLLRAFSLGGIYAGYALLGGLSSNHFTVALLFTALFLFLGMTGGRVIGDIRDLSLDEKLGKPTLPRKYGIKNSLIFLLVCQFLAYPCALAVHWTGNMDFEYIYYTGAMLVSGIIITIRFVKNPTSQAAAWTNKLSFGLLGGLYILSMLFSR
jgi:4-hydroxybenzoate polyprenyltransferase